MPEAETKTVSYTLRAGEGVAVGADWTLRLLRFAPYPVGRVNGPAGQVKVGLFAGAKFPLGPAMIVVTDAPHNGRRRARLLIRTPANIDVTLLTAH